MKIMTKKNKIITHRERVAELISNESELLTRLFEAPIDTRKRGNGPAKPSYANRKLKTICYLSGANIILLEKLVKNAQEKMPEGQKSKETKSAIINRMIEYWLEHAEIK